MENLITLAIFLAGIGILLAGVAAIWWVTIYDRINSPKKKITSRNMKD